MTDGFKEFIEKQTKDTSVSCPECGHTFKNPIYDQYNGKKKEKPKYGWFFSTIFDAPVWGYFDKERGRWVESRRTPKWQRGEKEAE